jgi:hypothetical protein
MAKSMVGRTGWSPIGDDRDCVVPSHATELTAIYLDRNVAGVLTFASGTTASPQQEARN